MTTHAVVTTAANGTQSVVDDVTVTGSGLGTPGNPVTSTTLTWTLFGPAAAVDGSCASVDWAAQSVRATGTITVTADGTYTTPATALSVAGCYTFDEELAATANALATSTSPGVAVETVYVAPPAATAATLAFTGFLGAEWWGLAAGALLAAGAGVLFLARRRRRTT